ncbi:MAG: Rrf2 family transcriptional regulator, partial [Acidobacteriaceae bacterium]|nr:Rrf2 family transcriptional regulator [Acidobacteriaceae bacterium]
MKLSSHEEYGLRCLLQVARHGATGSATIPEISRNEGISTPYVAKLMRILRRGGLVKAARGKAGGYTLALAPERILVGDALAVLGGRMYESDFCDRHAGSQDNCTHSTDCSIRSLWRAVQDAVDSIVRTTTIRDLLRSGSNGGGTA